MRPTTSGREPVVQATDLVKIYTTGSGEVRAVDGIDLSLERGSFTAIMGPSGSGKSTLMHCLAGLDQPTSGTITLAGKVISDMKDRELTILRRERVGFVFQQFNLLPTMTAEQNIVLPLDLAGARIDRDRLAAVVESLKLADRLHHRPSELSGGQQQRVAIARALITEPEVVFADEPTGALDSTTGHELLDYLAAASNDLGQTIVMVTHDPNAAAYAHRALILADGRIVEDIDAPDVDKTLAALKLADAPKTA